MDAIAAPGERRPRVVLHPCSMPGCPTLTDEPRCPAHQAQRELEIGTTADRGYGAGWRQIRAYKLHEDPLCELQTHCQHGIATEVHHKIPVRQWPDGRLRLDNLQSACKPCHSALTATRDGRARRQV
jgi:5-methylcytosine-specific restriction enzyme A